MPLSPAAPISILVVEDEWLLRADLAEALEESGCRVDVASNGESALGFLKRCGTLCAVVTDIRLGGAVDGWDVAEAARRLDPALLVIYTSTDLQAAAQPVPHSLLMEKPYDVGAIVRACLAAGLRRRVAGH